MLLVGFEVLAVCRPFYCKNFEQGTTLFGKRRNRCPRKSAFVFARWPHRTDGLAALCNCMFFTGCLNPNLLFPWGSGIPIYHSVSLDPTSVPAKWHLHLSNGLSRVHECDRRQTDRPHNGEMCSYRRNHLCCPERFLRPSQEWRRASGRPPTTWIHQICHDTGVTATEALQLAEDRPFWRTIATAGGFG